MEDSDKQTTVGTRIAFKHVEGGKVLHRVFDQPLTVDLNELLEDIHRGFTHGHRESTMILYNFQKPHISGYKGEVDCDSQPKWIAAVREWSSGILDRHKDHLKMIVFKVECELREEVDKKDHAADRIQRENSMIDYLETLRSLCGEPHAIACLLDERSIMPEIVADMMLQARDNVLEVLLGMLWCFLSQGGTKSAERLCKVGLTKLLTRRLRLFLNAHREHSQTETARILVPRFIACLIELAQIRESRSHFSTKTTMKTLLSMMSYCHARGLSDQITPLVSLLAPVVNPTTIPTEISYDDVQVIYTLASSSPRLATRCSALHVYVSWFNAKKSHTVEEVDENLRLLISEIKWALNNLDLPGKIIRYLSGKQHSRDQLLSQNPDFLDQLDIFRKQEPDLYVMLEKMAEQQMHQRISHISSPAKIKVHSNTHFTQAKKFNPNYSTNNEFHAAIQERRDRLDELLIVCVFGLWGYARRQGSSEEKAKDKAEVIGYESESSSSSSDEELSQSQSNHHHHKHRHQHGAHLQLANSVREVENRLLCIMQEHGISWLINVGKHHSNGDVVAGCTFGVFAELAFRFPLLQHRVCTKELTDLVIDKLERRLREDKASMEDIKAKVSNQTENGDSRTIPWNTVSQALNLSVRLTGYRETLLHLESNNFSQTLVYLPDGLQREARNLPNPARKESSSRKGRNTKMRQFANLGIPEKQSKKLLQDMRLISCILMHLCYSAPVVNECTNKYADASFLKKLFELLEYDDVITQTYTALAIWGISRSSTVRMVVGEKTLGVSIIIRMLSQAARRVSAHDQYRLPGTPVDPDMLKPFTDEELLRLTSLLGALWVLIFTDQNKTSAVRQGAVSVATSFLKWKDATDTITRSSIQILWMMSYKRQDVQDKIVRLGLTLTFVNMVRSKEIPFIRRCECFGLLETLYNNEVCRKVIQDELKIEFFMETLFLEMLADEEGTQSNPVGMMVYALCGLARFASRKIGKIILPKMGTVAKALTAIETGISKISGNKKLQAHAHESSDDSSNKSSSSSNDSEFSQPKDTHLHIMLIAKAMHTLMNLSTIPENQIFIARSGLSTIFKVAMQSTYISKEVHAYAARLLSNLQKHTQNRTPIYKLELKYKAQKARKGTNNASQLYNRSDLVPKLPGQETNDSSDSSDLRERIQKRRADQHAKFIARQEKARRNANTKAGMTKRYESKFRKWKEEQLKILRPPSVFSTIQRDSSAQLIERRNHTSKRNRKPRPLSANPIRKNRNVGSAVTFKHTSVMGKVPTRPQSANPRSVRISNRISQTGGRSGTSGHTLIQNRDEKNGLVHDMRQPTSLLWMKGPHASINATKVSMMCIGTSSEKSSTAPSPILQIQKAQVGTSNSSALSYLAPLVYEYEHAYTPWTPRIGKLICEPASKSPNGNQSATSHLGTAQAPTEENAKGNIADVPGNVSNELNEKATEEHRKHLNETAEMLLNTPAPPRGSPSSKRRAKRAEEWFRDYLERQADIEQGKVGALSMEPIMAKETMSLISHPVKVHLQPNAPDQQFHFSKVVDTGRNAPGPATARQAARRPWRGHRRTNELCTWQHREGSHVYDGIIPRYELPDGRKLYFFNSVNLHEQHSPAPLPTKIPYHLSDIGLSKLPQDPFPAAMPHHRDLPINKPTCISPKNLPAPKILDHTDHHTMTFTVGYHGMAKTSKLVRPPYVPPVFLLRYASADSQSLYNDRYDAIRVGPRAFEIDWDRVNNSIFRSSLKEILKGRMAGRQYEDFAGSIKSALKESYGIILGAFDYYSLHGTGASASWQLNEFTQFCKDVGISKSAHKPGSMSKTLIENLYKTLDSPTQTEGADAHEKSLLRYEFMALLVGLAVQKLIEESIDDGSVFIDPGEALLSLIKQHIKPSLHKDALMDADEFRESRLYSRGVNQVFEENLKLLHQTFVRYATNSAKLHGPGVAIFVHVLETKKKAAKRWAKARQASSLLARSAKLGAKRGRKGSIVLKKKHLRKMKRSDKKEKSKLEKVKNEAPPNIRSLSRADALIALAGYKVKDSQIEENLMSETKWIDLLREAGCIGACFSVRDAKHCFVWSRMRKADEISDASRVSSRDGGLLIGFTDFLEALARVAEKLPLPTMDQIVAEQGKGEDAVKKFVLNHMSSLKKNLVHGDTSGSSTKIKRRDSVKSFSSNKTRPLEEKLLVMLEVIKGSLHAGNELSKKMNESHLKQSGDKSWRKNVKR